MYGIVDRKAQQFSILFSFLLILVFGQIICSEEKVCRKYSSFSMGKPKVLVFDLDYTLWPFWVDTHIKSPIRKDKNNQVVDGYEKKVKYYPEVPEVLEKLKEEGYILGIASRTEWPEGAEKLLNLFDWNKYFTHKEIYPGKKTTHFQRIQKASGVSYSEMIFFDDEPRNIFDLKSIGVKSILVSDGVNKEVVAKAVQEFEKKS